MSAGIIQLVAVGPQDTYLINDPRITFFKMVYRRHTNFSTEVIPQNFLDRADFGKKVSCIISRGADLMRKIWIEIELPPIPQFLDENQEIDKVSKFAWARKIGFALIRTVEIEIGGELIDRQYGEWLNIWYELTVPYNQQINELIGNTEEIINFSNGKKSFKLFIPLQFWFNRVAGLALPIVSLQYNNIKINLEINEFEKCHLVAPTNYIVLENNFVNFKPNEYLIQTINGVTALGKFVHFDILTRRLYYSKITDSGFISLTNVTNSSSFVLLHQHDNNGNLVNRNYFIKGVSSNYEAIPEINSIERSYYNRSINLRNTQIKSCVLLVEYIFLDEEERRRFSLARHEYLIEQVLFDGDKTVEGTKQNFNLGYTLTCKEILWVTQLKLAQNPRNNDWFNYTDSMIRDSNGNLVGGNIIENETIMLNHHERVSLREAEYFTWIQPYQHHKNSPDGFINIYSFSLYPESYQPSGQINLSMIDSITLKIQVKPQINFKNPAKLRAYAIVQNILRISNGISGIVFKFE